MHKIAIIGAGSTSFTKNLLTAMFSYKNVKDCNFYFHDIDKKRMELIYEFAKVLKNQEKTEATFTCTTSLEKALDGADFVITTFTKGGLKAWELDLLIPEKYGVFQEAGDTMGAGGIFRAMRDIPEIVKIAKNMERLCPNGLLLNYANPLAPMIKSVKTVSSINIVGLCYGVRYTIAQLLGFLKLGEWIHHPDSLARRKGIVYSSIDNRVEFSYAGINHMTWITSLTLDKKDLYPDIRKLVDDKEIIKEDIIRFELLKMFDYFPTVNHWHMSDYLPYFKKNKTIMKRFLPNRWNLLEIEKEKNIKQVKTIKDEISGKKRVHVSQNIFNAPKIINAIINDELTKVNVNTTNDDFVPNLPTKSVIEIPAFVDKNGIRPCKVLNLSDSCASLNKTNILMQELLVKGVLQKDRKILKQALCLDPLTSAVCTLGEISDMFDEMHKAQKEYIDL